MTDTSVNIVSPPGSMSVRTIHPVQGDVPPVLSLDLGFTDAMLIMRVFTVHRFDSLLDVDILKRALAITLGKVPELVAKIEPCEDAAYGYRYTTTSPLQMEVVDVDIEGPISQDMGIPTPTTPYSWWNESSLLPVQQEDVNLDIRLTRFLRQGVTVLAVGRCHSVADGCSGHMILSEWSYQCGLIANKEKGTTGHIPSVPTLPEFDEGFTRYLEGLRSEDAKAKAVEKLEAELQMILDTQKTPNLEREATVASEKNLSFYSPCEGGILVMHNADTCSLRIDGPELRKLHEKVKQEAQSGQGVWVSTYEVLISILLYVLGKTAPRELPMCGHVIDSRGRDPGAGVMGNFCTLASHPLTERFQEVCGRSWQAAELVENLAALAAELHQEFRACVKSEDGLLWRWKAGVSLYDTHFELFKRTTFATELPTAPFFCFNRRKFGFFDMDFGSGAKPSLFACPCLARGMVALVPFQPDGSEMAQLRLTADEQARLLGVVAEVGLGSVLSIVQ